jgi:hypothetical protein
MIGPIAAASDDVNDSWNTIQKATRDGDFDIFYGIFSAGSCFTDASTIKEGYAINVGQLGERYKRQVKWLMGIAAKHKQLRILKYLAAQPLMEDIVKENQRYAESYEMISWAVQGGSLECVSVLLELNSNLVHCRAPHHIRDPPLLDAMDLKYTECLPMTKLLLSHGADPNGKAVMMNAYGRQRLEVFEALEDAGGVTQFFREGMVNEQILCRAASLGQIAIVENLIARGVDVNATYLQGDQYDRGPALWTAVAANRVEIVALLVAAGAASEVANCEGETAIQLAQQKGEEGKEMLKLLNAPLRANSS